MPIAKLPTTAPRELLPSIKAVEAVSLTTDGLELGSQILRTFQQNIFNELYFTFDLISAT